MFALVAAVCALRSCASTAAIETSLRLDQDQQWLVGFGNLREPDFRLRALLPVRTDGRPLLFSCSAAMADVHTANITWDLSSLEGGAVLSVDSRTNSLGSLVIADSLLTLRAPRGPRPASVACRIVLDSGHKMVLRSGLVGSRDHLQPPDHGEMHGDCSRRRCKAHGAACTSVQHSNRFEVLCACPSGRPVYDRFYDVCHKGRLLNERCLSSEACAFVDANSRCTNGTCQCLEGLQSHGLDPCRSWASYAEPCNGLVDCVGEGVVCGPSVCVCARGRVRVNDSCIAQPEEGLGDLNARQTIALVSSLLITATGVLLVLGSLCKGIFQSCCERANGRRFGKGVAAASYKLPQWADANSYYMSTRFWVSEQPYYSAAPKELHPKVYFAW